jgi:hypothetical protein
MAAPPAVTDYPTPHTWPASPIAYVWWESKPWGHVVSVELPYAGRWVLDPIRHVAPQSYPAPGGGHRSHGDTWCLRSYPATGGWCWSPGDTWHPRSSPEPGGASQSRGDTWHPRSSPAPGGGSRSCGDTCRPWSCPEPGGRYWRSTDTWRPQSCPEPGGGNHSTAPSSAPFRGRSRRGGACHTPR